ncbi:MAG: cyclase family protein, partial [Gemmataceae bacterium]
MLPGYRLIDLSVPLEHLAPSEPMPARTIDQVPLEWCFAPGVVLDMRHKASGDFITPEDLQAGLDRIGYR